MGTPRWRIQIQKAVVGEEWSNEYLTDDLLLDDAQDLSSQLLTFERNVHLTNVNFVYVRISSYIPGDRTFRHININQPGLLTTGDFMPLFNTARMDMGTSDSDPARKYYRLPVLETNQASGVFTPAFITTFTTQITNHLVTPGVFAHIVTTAGNTVTGATLHPLVQMRQLHRRKRKKVTP